MDLDTLLAILVGIGIGYSPWTWKWRTRFAMTYYFALFVVSVSLLVRSIS